MIKVMTGAHDNLPNDEYRDVLQVPEWIKQMETNKWIGDKTGQGFFKKTKDATGKKSFATLDWKTMEYKPSAKVKSETIGLKEYLKI